MVDPNKPFLQNDEELARLSDRMVRVLSGTDPMKDILADLLLKEIVLSIIEPNAKLDPKYQTIVVTTNDGRAFSGLVAEESDDTLTMLIGAGKLQEIAKDSIDERDNVSVSSMPERLQESMAPKEFIDLLEYMAQQKTKPEQP